MRTLIILFLFITCVAYGADPSTSVYQETTLDTDSYKEKLNGLKDSSGNTNNRLVFFQFADKDSIFGSIDAGMSGDALSVKLNAINYNLWFGGNKRIPFQLYVSETTSDEGNTDANTSKLLDPESGVAIKFPFLWTYQSSGDEYCAFLKGNNKIGHCSIGGDVIFNVKNLKDENGKTESYFGQSIRLGLAVLFPVLDAQDNSHQGYLSMAARLVFAHSDVDDTTMLFNPILDVNGDPIPFDNTIFSSELELKWSFTGKLAITAKWMKAFDNEYLDDSFRLAVESQF